MANPIARSWLLVLIGLPLAFGLFAGADAILPPDALLPRQILAALLDLWVLVVHGYGFLLTMRPASAEILNSFIFKPGPVTGLAMAAHGFALVMTLLMTLLFLVLP